MSMKLSIQEQLQRLEESTEARMKSRARKREQHALEENPMYRKGKGMGDFGKEEVQFKSVRLGRNKERQQVLTIDV